MDYDEIEVEALHELENLCDFFVAPLVQTQLFVLLLTKLWDIWINVKLLPVVKFFLLFFLDPVVNRTDFGVSLNDGTVDVMVDFSDLLDIILR